MASSTKVAGTIAENGLGGQPAWSNLANIGASDNSYATVTTVASYSPKTIRLTNFGFTIPEAATITGIIVTVERKTTDTFSGRPYTGATLRWNGNSYNSKMGVVWTTSDVTETHGDSTDMWNRTTAIWNPTNINSSTFGVDIGVGAPYVGWTLSIDYIAITVHYSCSTVIVDTTALDSGVEGVAYEDTLESTPSGLDWTVESGTLPTGLSLTTGTGVIAGTPSADGVSTFTVRATSDCDSEYGEKELSITIAALVNKSVTETVASVTESIALTSSTFDYSIANNNQAYVLNKKIFEHDSQHGWSFCDDSPFVKACYMVKDRKMIGVRRDKGTIASINYGDTFDGSDINAQFQTGYMNLSLLDEVKELVKEHDLSFTI